MSFNTTGLAFGGSCCCDSSNPTLQQVLTNGNTSVNLNLDLTNGSLISNSVYTNTVNSINAGNLTLNSTNGLVYIFAPSSPSGSVFIEAFSSIGLTATTDSINIQTGAGDIYINSHNNLNLISGTNCNITAPSGLNVTADNLTISSNSPTTTYNDFQGYLAGGSGTGSFNVCMGRRSGQAFTTAQNNSLIGYSSGDKLTSGNNNIMINCNAVIDTGNNNVIIGNVATNTPALSDVVVLGNNNLIDHDQVNVIGNGIATQATNSSYMNNIRNITTNTNNLTYNTSTKEITYEIKPVFVPPTVSVVPVSIVPIVLTLAMNLSTFIFSPIGGAIQNFTTGSLTGVPSGYTIYLRNGTSTDITLQINGFPVGTLHKPTGAVNSSFVLLWWNGVTMTAFL